MTLPVAIVAFDIANKVGVDFDPLNSRVWASTSAETIVDTEGNQIRVGTGAGTINADGTGSITVWVPGPGSNPGSWQTTLHFDLPARRRSTDRETPSFGPFTLTATGTQRVVSNKALASNVATITVTEAHGLGVGNAVTIAGVDSIFNGTHTITGVPSPTTLTYAKTASNVASAAAAGTLTSPHVNLADLIDEMPVRPEYASELADRVDGYTEHGNVSGPFTLEPPHGTHVLDVTGPTTLSIAEAPNGRLVTVAIRAGGTDVEWVDSIGFDAGTPEGLDVITLTFLRLRGFWIATAGAGAGGEAVEPVTDPPTQPGTVTVDPTADGFNLTVVASTVAAGYEWQIDGGPWVDGGTDLTFPHTGLAAGSTHSGAVRAYNSLGVKSTARTWGPASTDTVGLHEQLLAMNLDMYTRFSQGSIETFDDLTGTGWTAADGKTAPALNGPALSTGATGSAVFTTANTLKRTGIGSALDNTARLTFIMLVDASGRGGSNKLLTLHAPGGSVAVNDGQTYYDSNTLKHLFVINVYNDGVEQIRTSYRDGVPWNMTTSPFGLPLDNDVTDLYLNGWQFGGNEGGFLLDFIAIVAGTTVTQEQAEALAVAAGTFGNGGTA